MGRRFIGQGGGALLALGLWGCVSSWQVLEHQGPQPAPGQRLVSELSVAPLVWALDVPAEWNEIEHFAQHQHRFEEAYREQLSEELDVLGVSVVSGSAPESGPVLRTMVVGVLRDALPHMGCCDYLIAEVWLEGDSQGRAVRRLRVDSHRRAEGPAWTLAKRIEQACRNLGQAAAEVVVRRG